MSEKKHLRELLENSPDWIWEVDANGVYTYTSQSIEQILGYRREEVVGKTPFEFMPPEEAERVGTLFAEIVAERRSFQYLENVNLHRDGHRIVLETSGMPRFDADGSFIGYHGIDRDITQHKRMENQLLEEKHFLKAVLDMVSDLVVVFDRQGKIILFNREAQQATGYRGSEVVGKTVWDLLIAPAQREQHRRRFDRMIEEGDQEQVYESEWLTKGQQRLSLRWKSSLDQDERGEVKHVIAVGSRREGAGAEHESV